MPDKVKQVTSTEPDEKGTNQQITNNPDRLSTTTVKPGEKLVLQLLRILPFRFNLLSRSEVAWGQVILNG